MSAGRDFARVGKMDVERALRRVPAAARSDHDLNPPAPRGAAVTPAAVLCAILPRDAGLSVLFVRRSEDLPRHAGQIGFPGGRIDSGDRDSLAAALREAWEEVALDPATVESVGALERYRTGTGFEIVPHVGFGPAGFVPRPDGREVVAAFEVPLAFLIDPRNRRIERRRIGGANRRYYAYRYADRHIWGATAGILKSLADRFAD